MTAESIIITEIYYFKTSNKHFYYSLHIFLGNWLNSMIVLTYIFMQNLDFTIIKNHLDKKKIGFEYMNAINFIIKER